MLGEQLQLQVYCKRGKICFVHFSSCVTLSEKSGLLCFTLEKVMCILSSVVYYSRCSGLPITCRNDGAYLDVIGECLST